MNLLSKFVIFSFFTLLSFGFYPLVTNAEMSSEISSQNYMSELYLESSTIQSIEPNAEITRLWVRKTISLTALQAISPPKALWVKELHHGAELGGYLHLVSKAPYPSGYIYEGYLYNLKYPVPMLGIIEKEI